MKRHTQPPHDVNKKKVETKPLLELIQRTQTNEGSTMEFTIHNEDNTIGDLMKNKLLSHNDIVFCGHTPTHPLQSILQMRVVASHPDVLRVLQTNTHDLGNQMEHLGREFEQAMQTFHERAHKE
tara:strand:- start:969 stop:1340 length:372 start_codon:yes stop_codon:yes gene_type:complete